MFKDQFDNKLYFLKIKLTLGLCSTKLAKKLSDNCKTSLLNYKCLVKLIVKVVKNCKMIKKNHDLFRKSNKENK